MKKMVLFLIILGSLITGISAVVQFIDSQKKEQLRSINEEKLNNVIGKLRDENFELGNKIDILRKDNIDLSHQLTETSLKLNDNVIGEGRVDLEVNLYSNDEIRFRFVNNNNLPIYNALITTQDYDEIIKCEIMSQTADKISIKAECYENNFEQLGNLNFNPNSAILSNRKFKLKNGYMNFAIQITSRKKTIIYHYVFKLINDEFIASYRLYDLINQKKIFVEEKNLLNLSNDYWDKHFYLKVLYSLKRDV